MTCPQCGTTRIRRSQRKGIFDQLWATVGHWPYRCLHCGCRFRAQGRFVRKKYVDSSFRKNADIPRAAVVVEAETHEQLDRMLLAMSEAIESHRTATHAVR